MSVSYTYVRVEGESRIENLKEKGKENLRAVIQKGWNQSRVRWNCRRIS